MRGKVKWICAIVAAVAAVVSVMACNGGADEFLACPSGSSEGITCIWEGGVSFTPDEVSQADGFVFVTGEMMWGPCGATPGKQIRTYRVDPADGSTARMDAPATAKPVGIPAKGPIEVVPTGAVHRVRLERAPVVSVLKTSLPIGHIVDDANGEDLAEIIVAAACEG